MSTVHIVAHQPSHEMLVDVLQRLLPRTRPGDTVIVIGDDADIANAVAESHLLYDLESCPVCGGDVNILCILANTILSYTRASGGPSHETSTTH